MQQTRGDRYLATLEITPALRRAFANAPETLVHYAAAVHLTPSQISAFMRGTPFSAVVRGRIEEIGRMLGLPPGACVREVRR